jgi:hypothetical protein
VLCNLLVVLLSLEGWIKIGPISSTSSAQFLHGKKHSWLHCLSGLCLVFSNE